MSFKEELMALREQALDAKKDENRQATENFFGLVKQKLIAHFQSDPTHPCVSIYLSALDSNLTKGLIGKIDENYLRHLCQVEGINVVFMQSGIWFEIDLTKQGPKKTK